LQLHIAIFYVMLHSVELFPNLLEKNWKLNFIKLTRKRIDLYDR